MKTGPKPINHAGQTFTRLRVIKRAPSTNGGAIRWWCECQCGTRRAVTGSNLRNGSAKSCGCLRRERFIANLKTHGMSKTPIYNAWRAMLERCYNPKSEFFQYYGGRGITVTRRWHKFEAFYEDMGPRPDGYTLERRNNALGYSNGNCCWATRATQMRNQRRNHFYERNGVRLCLADWEIKLGLKSGHISKRLHKGWAIDRAVSPATTVSRNQHGQFTSI